MSTTALSTTQPKRRRRDERGMSTVEYAVGTVAAASLGSVLIKIVMDPQVRELVLRLLMEIIGHFMKVG